MTTNQRRPLLIFLSLACMLMAVSDANADDSVQAKEKAARAACLSGDPAKGVSILAELFVDSREPTYIFNQGRCFEQNGRNREAIDRFREYLRIVPANNTSAIAETNKHIADCQALMDSQQAEGKEKPEPPAPPPSVPPPPSTDPSPPPSPAISDTTLVSPTESIESPPGSGLRTTGIVVAAVGGAALVAGAILNIKVNQMASDLEKPGEYSRKTNSDRADYATMGWISYGVGGALLAGGTLLYYLGWSQAQTGSTSLSFVPTVAPGQIGAGFKGEF